MLMQYHLQYVLLSDRNLKFLLFVLQKQPNCTIIQVCVHYRKNPRKEFLLSMQYKYHTIVVRCQSNVCNFWLFFTPLDYTRSVRNGLLFVSSYNTVSFGRKSIIHSTTLTWNYLQDKLTEYNFLCFTPKSLKILLVKFFICEYNS